MQAELLDHSYPGFDSRDSEHLGPRAALFEPLIFAKLYLTELLPPQVERIIFLDSDLLVFRDLLDLWFTDTGGKILAAARTA